MWENIPQVYLEWEKAKYIIRYIVEIIQINLYWNTWVNDTKILRYITNLVQTFAFQQIK